MKLVACAARSPAIIPRTFHEPTVRSAAPDGLRHPDVEAAMKIFIEVCGVGLWFYAERLSLTSFSYGGRRFTTFHPSIALANSGEMQIELIQQRSDHPSMGRDFLARKPQGRAAVLVELAGELQRALSSARWPTATWSVRKAMHRADASCISVTRAIPGTTIETSGLSPRCAGASSTRCARRRPGGMARTRSAPVGRADTHAAKKKKKKKKMVVRSSSMKLTHRNRLRLSAPAIALNGLSSG